MSILRHDATGLPLVMVSDLGSSMDNRDSAITNEFAQKNKAIIFNIEGVKRSNKWYSRNWRTIKIGMDKFAKKYLYMKQYKREIIGDP